MEALFQYLQGMFIVCKCKHIMHNQDNFDGAVFCVGYLFSESGGRRVM